MPRHRLTIAYDGTDFHGWQHQRTPDGAVVRTVQETLTEAVREVVRSTEAVAVVGASRTDAGVHARGQVAAFTAEHGVPLERLPEAINARLPDDVQVLDARIVVDDFDPIAGAVAKSYSYHLSHGVRSVGRPLFDRRIVAWTAHALDVEAM
ncbi:MAG: tRNA pseudouridine synthase A, partial [Planctomycetota bacterium]